MEIRICIRAHVIYDVVLWDAIWVGIVTVDNYVAGPNHCTAVRMVSSHIAKRQTFVQSVFLGTVRIYDLGAVSGVC